MSVGRSEPGTLQRVVPWLVALALLAVIAGLTIWARQQDAARRIAEVRAEAAEARASVAEASLTAIARSSAAAAATAQASGSQPEAALRRALALVFEAYKDPSDARLRALSDAFSPEALNFERNEAEHLISGGLHLAGATPFDLQILETNVKPTGETDIRTHEVWTYDEVDGQNRRVRCVRDESEQTYTLKRVPAGWLVQDVQLQGNTRRTDC